MDTLCGGITGVFSCHTYVGFPSNRSRATACHNCELCVVPLRSLAELHFPGRPLLKDPWGVHWVIHKILGCPTISFP